MGSMLTPGSVRTELNGGDTQLVSRVEALVDVCGVEGGGGTHTFGVRNDKSKKIKKKKKPHLGFEHSDASKKPSTGIRGQGQALGKLK